MQKQIEQYIENIKKDYVGFGRPQTKTQQEVHENMKNEFNDSIRVEPGKKYIKITTAIKAASWQNPTLNAPRGNIFGDYVVKWTGACYMDGQKRILV